MGKALKAHYVSRFLVVLGVHFQTSRFSQRLADVLYARFTFLEHTSRSLNTLHVPSARFTIFRYLSLVTLSSRSHIMLHTFSQQITLFPNILSSIYLLPFSPRPFSRISHITNYGSKEHTKERLPGRELSQRLSLT